MCNAALSINHKLYNYIRVADDEKLQAIYLPLENEIENTQEWWKNKMLITEFDKRHNTLENGTDKGIAIDAPETQINKLRTKKQD